VANISETSLQKEPRSTDGFKKKVKTIPSEPKVAYKLQFTDHNLNSVELGEAELEEFKAKHPLIARLLAHPEYLSTSSTIAAKATQDNWVAAALTLLGAAWKIRDAHLFHAPVDVKRLGIPDYLNIVKKPMDFGTIKVTLPAQAPSQCLRKSQRVPRRHGPGVH
jgi:hypothetical protein